VSKRVPRAALAFATALLLHDPLITLSGSALPAHALLGLGLLWFSATLVISALRTGRMQWSGGMTTLTALLPMVSLGLIYCLIDQGDLDVRIQFLATFVLAPLIWCALSQLSATEAGRRAVGRLLLIYVATEFSLMLLQISYFLIGAGIAPGETYESMIPGSQFNGNNLACIIVTLSVFYNAVSADWPRWQRRAFNIIVVLILIITFSRLAVALYVVDRVRTLRVRNIRIVLLSVVALITAGMLLSQIDSTGNETIDASLYKAKSLATIAEVGFEADSSTSSRSESYINFFDKLGSLGFGSAQILNYSRFTSDAVFADETLYIDPHSMLIEFGYWMGWPGLIVLGLFLGLAYWRRRQGGWVQRGFIFTAVLLASSIPSSAIPLPNLWVGMLLLGMVSSYRPRPSRVRSEEVMS
jgi:hypothetical protein